MTVRRESVQHAAAHLSVLLEGGRQHNEPEVTEEDLVPLSTYLSKIKFWWKVVQWPFLVLVVNIVLLITLVLDEDEDAYNHPYLDQEIVMMRTGTMYGCIILVINVVLIYRTARWLETEVHAMQQQPPQQAETDPETNEDHQNTTTSTNTTTGAVTSPSVYAQLAHKMDIILSGSQQPHRRHKTCLVVNLMWLLMATGLVGALVCFFVSAYLWTPQTMCGHDQESGRNHHSNSNNLSNRTMEGIPSDLQAWVHDCLSDRRSFKWCRQEMSDINLLHTTNGNTFFTSRIGDRFGMLEVLFRAHPNGSISNYSDMVHPTHITNVKGPSLLNSELGCWQYAGGTGEITKQHRIGCYNVQDDSITQHVIFTSTEAEIQATNASGGKLYVMAREYEHNHHYHYGKRLIYSVDVVNRQNGTLVAYDYGGASEDSNNERKCESYIKALTMGIGSLGCFVAAWWLFQIKSLPSAVPMGCFGTVLMLGWLSDKLAELSTLLISIGINITLLCGGIKGGHKELLIWAAYTLVFLIVFMDLIDNGSEALPILSLILSFVVALVHNHPIPYIVAFLAVVAGGITAIANLLQPDAWGVIISITMGIVVSCGCCSVGNWLSKYRVHFRLYMLRLWRGLNPGRASRNGPMEPLIGGGFYPP